MAITINTKIDIISKGVMPVIHLSQYDSDFTLTFTVFSSEGTFTMPSGTTAEIRGTKADGNGYSAAGSVSDNVVTITGDEQITAAAGWNIFEIALYKSSKRLNTINFVIDVERAALDADTITSESVLRELDAIIAGAETATNAAGEAVAAAETVTTLKSAVYGEIFNSAGYDWDDISSTDYPLGWRTGYYNASTGAGTASNNYIRTASKVSFPDNTKEFVATAPDGYAIAAYEYAADGTYIRKIGVQVASDSGATQTIDVAYTQGHKYHFSLGTFNLDAANYLTEEFIDSITLDILTSHIDELEAGIDANADALEDLAGEVLDIEDYDWTDIGSTDYPYGWRTGYYDASTGAATSSENYMRTVSKITFPDLAKKITATAPEGYAIAAYEYNASDTYIRKIGMQNKYDSTATNSIDVEITKGYKYHFALGTFNSDSEDYLTEEFTSSIALKVTTNLIDETNDRIETVIGGAVHYGSPSSSGKIMLPDIVHSETYWNYKYDADGTVRKVTQGICSDGQRYLFFPFKEKAGNSGDDEIPVMCKYDTYLRRPVIFDTTATKSYGHIEDMCFVPAYVPGLDNGNVDRIYLVDMNRSTAAGETGAIHVLKAEDLTFIETIQTYDANDDTKNLISTTLAPYWVGVFHIGYSPEQELFFVHSASSDENSVRRQTMAVLDKSGNLIKGVNFIRASGTIYGCDCDENYIYLSRYINTQTEDVFNIYLYAFDWDLNPVARVTIDQMTWEVEGVCHIDKDFYVSWLKKAGLARDGILITKSTYVKNQYYDVDFEFPTEDFGTVFRDFNYFTPTE